jgi:hypothetical protein
MQQAQARHATAPRLVNFSAGFIRVRRKIPPYTDISGFKNA